MTWLAAALLTCLGGCATTNTSYDNLQLDGRMLPMPADYRGQLQQMVAGLPKAGPLLVSEPQSLSGVTVFSPKRRYVCILGIDPHGHGRSSRNWTQEGIVQWAAEKAFDPGAGDDRFEEIVIFDRLGANKPMPAFGSPLCEGENYSPL